MGVYLFRCNMALNSVLGSGVLSLQYNLSSRCLLLMAVKYLDWALGRLKYMYVVTFLILG